MPRAAQAWWAAPWLALARALALPPRLLYFLFTRPCCLSRTSVSPPLAPALVYLSSVWGVAIHPRCQN